MIDVCKEILGEEDFKDLPPIVLACVKENSGLLDSEGMERVLRKAWFKKPLETHGILLYLAYVGKITIRQNADGNFKWYIHEWSGVMTEEAMQKAVEDWVADRQGYKLASEATAICLIGVEYSELLNVIFEAKRLGF